MPTKKLKEFLTQNKIHYLSISHPVAYATREISHLSHIAEQTLAKTVVIHAGSKTVMVVIPSNEAINFDSLKKSLKESSVELVPENNFSKLFPDCELGAMPPFGNLYNLDVYVEKNLTKNKDIAFNAGSHTELIKMSYQDFEKLVHPTIITATH
jgi:Ala-tRNA(Pro) deacylase